MTLRRLRVKTCNTLLRALIWARQLRITRQVTHRRSISDADVRCELAGETRNTPGLATRISACWCTAAASRRVNWASNRVETTTRRNFALMHFLCCTCIVLSRSLGQMPDGSLASSPRPASWRIPRQGSRGRMLACKTLPRTIVNWHRIKFIKVRIRNLDSEHS